MDFFKRDFILITKYEWSYVMHILGHAQTADSGVEVWENGQSKQASKIVKID